MMQVPSWASPSDCPVSAVTQRILQKNLKFLPMLIGEAMSCEKSTTNGMMVGQLEAGGYSIFVPFDRFSNGIGSNATKIERAVW